MANNILQKIQKALKPEDGDFGNFDNKVEDYRKNLFEKKVEAVKNQLTQDVKVKTVDEVNSQLSAFKESLNLESIIQAMQSLEEEVNAKVEELSAQIEETGRIADSTIRSSSDESRQMAQSEITGLKNSLASLSEEHNSLFTGAKGEVGKLQNYFNGKVSQITADLAKLKTENTDEETAIKKDIKDLEQALEKLRKEFNNRINNVGGGGNMNRQVSWGGNTSVLGKYTDYNFQNSSSIGWIYSNDDTNKRVNISASMLLAGAGSGGSVTGITRTTSIITASQTGGATAGVDYVYFAAAGLNLTLPTAVSNNNQYTVKNVSASSVIVTTTAGQTIDGSASALMPVANQSLDFISNSSVWNVV